MSPTCWLLGCKLWVKNQVFWHVDAARPVYRKPLADFGGELLGPDNRRQPSTGTETSMSLTTQLRGHVH